MKIERINDNQIRCILSKQDLRDRNLQLSEFVYGSDKARELFSDMMQKASTECAFEAEDTPLMIEAIPTSPDSLMLIITKIDNPEELDTRFSSFTPYHDDEETDESDVAETAETTSPFASKMLDHLQQITGDFLSKLKQAKAPATATPAEKEAPTRIEPTADVAKAFYFRSFEDLTSYARIVGRIYTGESSLYKDTTGRGYVLCLEPGNVDAVQFNKVCNIACEYSSMAERATIPYYREHYQCILADQALANLIA